MIFEILKLAIEKGASDIHLTSNTYPILRINGELTELRQFEKNTPELLSEQLPKILNEKEIEFYQENLQIDSALSFQDMRFRINVFKQMECDAYVLRLIPSKMPKFEEMNLPKVIRKFTMEKNGLVLVTGSTGSGKSTTLAAIIDEINANERKHIITIEDPVEFIHSHKKCIVNQRQVGIDVKNFADAVKGAMREDPDILLVGEMRDLETIHNAITMAETGHLVFGTLHTKSVAETVDRIIDVFPPEQQDQIRFQLANSIKGIVCQSLLPKKGGGRVPMCEVLIFEPSTQNLIKKKASPETIVMEMQTKHRTLGCQTKTQSLANLYKEGLITLEVAREYLEDKEGEITTFNTLIATKR